MTRLPQLHLNVEPKLIDAIRKVATADNRTVNAEAITLLTEALAARKAKQA